MNRKDNKEILTSQRNNNKDGKILPGYPDNPTNEDIYDQCKEEGNIDPEDISKAKKPVEKSKPGNKNEKSFEEDKSGSDLDVPGSELDDEQEKNGNEDEENNYYSIGGDDHDDLG
jgi:hypothetical protein